MNVIEVELSSPNALEGDIGAAKLVQGPRGEPGAVFVPEVADGVISWTNDAGLPNPEPADIRGPQGEPGESPYEAAAAEGYTGTEADFYAALLALGDINAVLDEINGEVV